VTTEGETPSSSHYPLCRFDDLPLRGAKAISVEGVNAQGEVESCPLVVVRWDDTVYGYINHCPHMPTQLDGRSAGSFFNQERSHLMCERHGALFEVDTGLCLDGPCEGKGLTPLTLAVIDGSVCITNIRYADTAA
jgi:nitrite reductase/ring-hydroxylating ferredoxin subunit